MAEEHDRLAAMTTTVVSAFVENNEIRPADLPGLIVAVHAALKGVGEPAAAQVEDVARPTKAEIRKSIGATTLTSFLDGRPYRALKRHLSAQGMTPAEYRERFGLPADYPMVHPTYSDVRSQLAKALGLGQKGKAAMTRPARRTSRT